MESNPAPFTEQQARIIAALVTKQSGLRLDMKFTHLEAGPVITNYFFKPSHSIPLAKILNREDDFASACGVSSVLIERDGDKISVSVPNVERQIIDFNTCLYQAAHCAFPRLSLENKDDFIALPLLVGVDTKGTYSVLALEKQPHVLIAGSTGSGKSVLLASFIAGLAVLRTYKEMKLILVDTKKLDLPLFKDLPHVVDCVEDVESFHNMIDKMMKIVRQRTNMMQGVARNIGEYNSLKRTMGEQEMPYYVIIVDELADLVDTDAAYRKEDINDYKERHPTGINTRIKSLVQICRAIGIHLIIATQRTSVKIINGDIKANLPTRIALKLPSLADSRTILDTTGAQYLLGQGDMLVQSVSQDTPTRYHGAYTTMENICRITNESDQIREILRGVIK